MKTRLLFSFMVASLWLGAQTTHQLSWGNDGSDAGQALTIEVGDTVEWTWGAGTHNLVSTSGVETFDSGYESSGFVWSHTFTIVGSTDYVCSPHAGNMNGTITATEAAPSSDLALQGILDLNIVDDGYGVNGSQGKAIHVLATADIADLSIYGIGVANNGGGTDGEEYNFDSTASATAGDNILVVRSVEAMNAYMDASTIFDQVILGSSSISQNGNDAIELYLNGTIVEVFGDADVNPDTFGAGCGDDVNCWDYEDSWAYKIGGTWTYGGVNCSDGTATTWDSTCVYPFAIGQEPVTFTPPTWAGDWILDPVAGALAVGPNAGSVGDWWSSSAGDVDTRACLFDDIHRFNADGSYEQIMQDQTWLEGWQGVAEGCGTPVAPHDGSNAATYTYTDTSVTVIGDGAFMGLAKVHNTGEDGVSGGEITYNIVSVDENYMVVNIAYAPGADNTWQFMFRNAAYTPPPVETTDVTFTVNTSTIEVGANGMYLGGGILGDATAYAMSDADGDGTWEVTLTLDEGTTGNYIFLNSPNDGGDWGAKEVLTGQECADGQYDDRLLAPVGADDYTLQHCFGSCETDGSCPAPPSEDPVCAHTLYMVDSYGDGWNGNAVDVLVNGVVVLDDATIASGSNAEATFEASTGDAITLAWTEGSYTSEVSWSITDGEGTEIATGAFGADAAGTTAYCTPPPPCAHTLYMVDSYGDGWNGNAIDVLVNGVVVVDDATIASGSNAEATFEAASGDTIDVTWTEGSYTSEVSWSITDGAGVEIAGGAFGADTAGALASCPSCLPVSDLTVSDISTTGAVLSWTSEGSQFMIEIQPAGSPQGTEGGYTIGDIEAYTATAVDLTGYLADNTAYDIYVINVCDGASSNWAGPATFTTLALPIVPDYTNDFSEFPGDLWSAGSPTGSFASAWLADGFANDGTTGAAKTNIYSSNNTQVLESPIFDLTGGNYSLNLKAAVTAWNTTDALAMGSDDSVTVSVSVDGGDYVVLHTWNESNNPGPTGTDMPTVDLSSYSSANVKFAITMSDGTVNDAEDYDFFVDDFSITLPFVSPSWAGDWYIDPTAGALAVGPNAGDLSWWSSSADDVTTRACLFDDIYRFGADGTFENILGDQTWLEGWQEGQEGEGCGTPIAPHDGSNPATYSYTDTSVTLSGSGAFLGLAKVHNTGEDGAPVDDTITYEVISVDETYMTVHINFGPGVWAFRFINSTALGIEDVDTVSSFNFYPNPVNDMLTIKAQASIDSITVYNMLGQAVVRSTPNAIESTVDMSALQTGAYFVQVSINNTLKTVRVVKN